jgi:hypothetical protein
MNDEAHDLMQRFIDDRDQLSDAELESLTTILRARPQLASELKEQLLIDELLAQQLTLTRWHFLPQVDQRIRDEAEGFAAIRPPELNGRCEVATKTRCARGDRAGWRRSWRLALGLAALLALGGAWLSLERSGIAVVESAEGGLGIIRRGRQWPAQAAERILPGDRIAAEAGATGGLRYADGTILRVEPETSLTFERNGFSGGKRVFVQQGRVSATVVPQAPGCPMIFESATATAEVVGTALQFSVQDEGTEVTVTEGQVRIRSNTADESLTVSKDEFAVVTPRAVSSAPVGWPSNRDGLIFLFETNDRPNLVRSSATGLNRSYSLRPRGAAHLNHDYALVLTGGAFLAEDVDGEILAGCQKTNELSIEADIRPSQPNQKGPARIVTFSTDPSNRDFTIGQLGDQLIVRIRTPQTGLNGVAGIDPGLPVCRLKSDAVNHVLISYRPGKLACYLDGRLVFEGEQIQGDFRDWSAQHLLFGDEYGGERNWAGTLEGVAIYNRFIGPEEAARNAAQYEHLRRSRRMTPQLRVRAELLEKSRLPTVEDVQPHRCALVVCRYRVQAVLRGAAPLQNELFVAEWALLDGQPQPIVTASIGSAADLLLEPLDRNPQLQRCFSSDDFHPESGIPRYFEVRH